MEIIVKDLHEKDNEEFKYIQQLVEWEADKKNKKEPDSSMFLDEEVEALRKHKDEILLALNKYDRVYLVICETPKYTGVYNSVSQVRLTKIVEDKKMQKSGYEQNKAVCLTMAFHDEVIANNTKLELTQILGKNEKSKSVPKTIVYSIGNALLNREGIGINVAGK